MAPLRIGIAGYGAASLINEDRLLTSTFGRNMSVGTAAAIAISDISPGSIFANVHHVERGRLDAADTDPKKRAQAFLPAEPTIPKVVNPTYTLSKAAMPYLEPVRESDCKSRFS